MRILTWNINSVRLRIDLLKNLMISSSPDVICLQETKATDDVFPLDDIKNAGYEHCHIHGMKSYNGVAILSRRPFIKQEIHHHCNKEDRRHISVSVENQTTNRPIHIHCLYIPAGGYEPDPEENDKFAHKLDFIDEMTQWFPENTAPDEQSIVAGDFNVAPQENDVWSHKQLINTVSHTEAEVSRLNKMQRSLKWIDTQRHFVPSDQKAYTWWSYRNRNWATSDRGRRLDHIWITPSLLPSLRSSEAVKEARGWKKMSDHIPVMAELDGV